MHDDGLNPKNRGLGRGLGALFEDDEGVYPQVDAEGHTPGRKRDMVPVEMLTPGAAQPRLDFDDEALGELANSIKEHGLLQPLLVRARQGQDGQYEIVAGERRWRAAQIAQLHELPVIVLDIDDAQAMQIALIENLQREDLNPLEEAEAYTRLQEEFEYTQDKLAKVLGKSRPYIANMTRLLSLPDSVQAYVREGQLSTGHARALIAARDPAGLAKHVIAHNMSVRETEKLVADDNANKPIDMSPSRKKNQKGPDTRLLEQEITNLIGMKFRIESRSGKKGYVRIDFKDLDQLDALLNLISSQGNTSAESKRLMG